MECFAFACLIELAAARLFFLTLWGHIYIYNMDCRGLAISTCSNVHKTVSWYCHRAIGAGFCVFARRKTIALGCSVQRSVIILHPYPTYLCLLFLPTCDKIIRFHNQKGCLKFGMMLSHSIAVYGRKCSQSFDSSQSTPNLSRVRANGKNALFLFVSFRTRNLPGEAGTAGTPDLQDGCSVAPPMGSHEDMSKSDSANSRQRLHRPSRLR